MFSRHIQRIFAVCMLYIYIYFYKCNVIPDHFHFFFPWLLSNAWLKLWLLRHPLHRKLSQGNTLPSTDRATITITTTIWAVFSLFLFFFSLSLSVLEIVTYVKFINKKWAHETLKPTFNPNKKRIPALGPLSLSCPLSAILLCGQSVPWNFQDKQVINLFSPKIWLCLLLRASCNHTKNHKGWSSHNMDYQMTETSTKKFT